MENVTDILCDFAFSLNYSSFSEMTITQTKKFIVDYFSSSLAGYKLNQSFNSAVLNVFRGLEGKCQSSVLFEKNKYPAPTAAFVNAVYSHGADLDDGNRISAGHIGTHVISSVFALAESQNSSWKDVIMAINVGYEFFNRIGGAAQPALYNKGFHSTGVAGTLASAAACAKLLGLDKKGIYNGVSIAAIQSGGLIIIDESGQGCKPINPANAARAGMISALLAAQGVEGPRNPLESKKGWFHAFSDERNTDLITEGLGTTFTINESYLKIYPTCRHTHSCMEAALELRKKLLDANSLNPEMIKEIQVYTYPSAIKSAGAITIPNSAEEAKFSMAFAFAVALFKGGFGLKDLDPSTAPAEVSELARLVHLAPDPSMENREKGIRGARVEIFLQNGLSFEKTILTPKGEGKDSLTWEDLEKKMLSCGQSLTQPCRSQRLFDACKNMDEDAPFSYLASILI